jgi:hypothetical protein
MTPLIYQPPKKVAIVGMEIKIDLVAQYNPKELQIETSADWKASPNSKSDNPDFEYTSSPARTLSMELLFDTYEDDEDVGEKYVSKLTQLISVMDPDGVEAKKRPSIIQVCWPEDSSASFQGVLQSVSTKYTMFAHKGYPVRAVCSIKVMEVLRKFPREPSRMAPRKRDFGW